MVVDGNGLAVLDLQQKTREDVWLPLEIAAAHIVVGYKQIPNLCSASGTLPQPLDEVAG